MNKEFLIATGLTVELSDGQQVTDVAWKHCADNVLRFYVADGTQIHNITKCAGGTVLIRLEELVYLKTHCREER